MNNRNDLALYFAEQGFNWGAEIGVAAGKYSEILCKANPNLRLYCIDLWGTASRRPEHRIKREYSEAKVRLKGLNATMVKKFSMEAVHDFDDRSLDFVYIDAAHDFDNAMLDIIMWGMKVRTGGVISGHDYGNSKRCGVKDAVNTYAKWHNMEVHVLPEPDIIWTPKYPSDEIAGLSWWLQK